ncbi:hypothetical protein [Actinoplanes sp. NBRC 103695]|uniref:hypothetical protein n=1 Tax=Actinoplanes sp. NBRC 103695 TaxID=3032202 RepID=UPI0024A1019D|nr:hypothetical protein [Actinoplanes sp. NBRC 103695]GLY94767.1 hypothetical protein Acsp02_20220 [Actinoplanes sp. NBRC 103695]
MPEAPAGQTGGASVAGQVSGTPMAHGPAAPAAQPSTPYPTAAAYGPFHTDAAHHESSSGPQHPGSGAPAYGAAPSSGGPYTSDPSHGAPYASDPSSGAPQWTAPPSEEAVDAYGLPIAPSSGGGLDQYGLGPSSGAPRFGPGSQGGAGSLGGAGSHDGAGSQDGLGSAGSPASGDPFGPGVGGGAPRFGPGGDEAYGPSSGGPGYGSDDRFGFEPGPRPGPRIEPSPPKQRNKLVFGILAGLAAGLLIFGAPGFFIGRETAPSASPEPATPAPSTSAAPAFGVYEQSQIELNKARLTDALAPAAQGWLPYLSNCEKNGEVGGPILNKGEKTRVRCRLDGMSMIFVEFATVTDRDKARVKTLSQNVDARTLTPGVGPAGDKATPSGRTSGSYVEYAYTVEENRARQTVAGIWWDDTKTPVAAYMLAFWKSGVGEDWAPMRDLWGRYA